jgi:DNA-binding transcriptional MerR regulator
MPNTSTSPPSSTAKHRIGAVAALSGVPVTTLRVWELRYGTFTPLLTDGRQRVYSDEDVLRATLLRRLTDHGHAISSIAMYDAAALNGLLLQQDTTQRRNGGKTSQRQTLNVAVVGLALAARLATVKFKQKFASNALQVTDIFSDVEAALAAPMSVPPDYLLIRVNSLHALVHVQLHRLLDNGSIPQVIVLYHFGQEHVIESMRRSGMVVRREPVTDYELADLFHASLLIDAPQAMAHTGTAAIIPPRKYDDATLAHMAAISTNMLCECPRHVAEIIAQLVGFEQYSWECLNKSAEDAHLHAYLHSVSGSARALFEQALKMVAEHEGLSIEASERGSVAVSREAIARNRT